MRYAVVHVPTWPWQPTEHRYLQATPGLRKGDLAELTVAGRAKRAPTGSPFVLGEVVRVLSERETAALQRKWAKEEWPGPRFYDWS